MTHIASIRRATAADADAIVTLVRDAQLAVPGVVEHVETFLVAERDQRAVGAIGLEVRGTDALLRSAVVSPEARGAGIGASLVTAVFDLARGEGVETMYLLTTSAQGYWARQGFVVVSRDVVPDAVKRSEEFVGACPAAAAAMMRSV